MTNGGRNEAQGSSINGVGWPGLVLLIVVGLVALWFCIRGMILGLYQREYPLIGTALSPPSAVSQAVIALNRASVRDGLADPLARDLTQRALRRGPLLSEPFIVAGLDASARGDLPRAQRLMEEAQRRNPRAVIARYWLFDNYLRDGAFAEGIAEAAPLIRLQPAAAPAAIAVLTALIKVPGARPPLVEALRGNAPWRGVFFQQAATSPSLRVAAAALLRDVAAGDTTSAAKSQQIVQAMVASGQYDDAYALWLRALPPDKRPRPHDLVDGSFDRVSGPPPFGWRLSSAGGSVEPTAAPEARSGAGLAIRMGGDAAATIAEQLVLARPGPLRMAFATRSLESTSSAAGLKMELRCGVGGASLDSQTVERFSPRLETHVLATSVPPTCGAVLIRASVVPGIEAGPLNVLLTGVTLSER